jgi:rare lipoprotein A
MKRLLSIALLACAVSSALAQEEPAVPDVADAVAAADGTSTPIAADITPLKRLETGIASWYGKQFHGRKTASGERFDMDALTAAHPKLPFGSWVRVRNLLNGRSVDVRINDRGPHIKQRVIDLSRAAARALGVSGTDQVELSVLAPRR